ncbi:hypothetical protein, conserved [Eimeria tenella]|uniref:Uncharacterized protein n=1 Tax=Eimeria tenella TaxID=5802 RepID=U6KSJ0_EIMTE|nr:hypothetical protein, conserved [Eimeria tenella]CDJ41087.1 hypothetical protein, conserved [Eimeria tenella]|eukprot:XP_013231837.1 hypothetical protein, conserved [Eimeria tenella]
MCLFCLGGYGKCAGLMIFLALAIACGRLLMNFPFGSCLRLHEARDKKGHSRLFLVSSGIQVVALVGALAVICTVKHPTVKTQQKRPAKVALAMSLVAIFLDFILLCAQIAAYKFSKLAETPGQRAAVVIAGGDFDEPAAQLCIVGRLNVHYDVECATYESTYSYYLVVQSYAGKTLWCLLLGTVKTPLPKALREQQRQRRKLQEIYFSPSATAAAPTEPQKLNLETTVLLSLHSKAFAREASRALDVVGVRRLQTLVLAAFGSTDLNGGLSTPVKLHQQQAHKHSAAFSQSGYLDTETSHGLVTASHSPSLHSLSPHKEAAYNAEPSCRKCSDKDANFSLPMDQRRSSGASMRGPSTRDSENCSGRQRRPSESLHLHENRSRKNSSGKLKTARSYHRDRSNKGARAHSKRQSNEAVKEDHERKAVAPVDDHTTRANEPPSKVATISADVDATMPSKSANPFDEEKEEAVALPPLPAVADEEGSRGSMHLDGCDQQSSSPVEAPVASAEKAAAVVTGDCEAALLHNLSEVLKQLQIEHPQLLKSVPYFATKLQEEGAQRALGELLEQMPSNKKALLATCYSCTEARRDFTTDWQLTELMKLLRDAEILQKQRDGQGLQVQDQQLQHEQQQQEQKVLQAEPKLQQVQQEQQQEEVPLQEQQQEEVPLQEQQQQVQQHEERKALQEEPKQRLHEQEQQQEPMQLSEQDQQLQQQDQKVLLEQHQHLQQQEEQKILQEQEQEKHARLAEEQQMQLEEMQQQNERQQQPQQQKLHCMQQGQQLQQAQQLQPVHQQQWQEENQLQQNQLHEEQQKPQHEYRQQQPQEEAQSQVQQEEVEQRLQEIKCAKQQVQLLQQNEQDKFQTLQQQKEQQMQQERQQTLEEKQQQQELQQMQQEDLLRQQETQRPSQEEEQQQRQQKHEECGSINPVQDEGTAASPMPAAKEAEDDEVGPWSPVEAATQGEAVATPTETKLLSEDQTVKTGLTIGAADASDAAGAAAAGVTEVEVAAMAGDAAAFSPGHRRPATGGTGPLAHEVPQGLSYSPDSAAEASTAGCAIPLPPFQDSADLLTPLESRGSIGGPLGCPLIAEDEAEEIQERLLRHVAQQQRSAAGTGSNSSMVFFPHGAFDSFLPEGDPGTKTQCDAASEGEAETVFSVFLTRQRQKQAHEARSASASPTVPLCISDIDMLSYSLPASSSRYNQQLSDQQQQTRVPFEEVCNPSLLPTLEPLDLRYPSVGPISEAPLSSRGVLSSEGPSVQSTRTSAGSSMAGPLTARETPVVRSPTWLISQQAESPQTILLQRRRGGVSESIEERPHAAVAAAAGNARASLRAAEATSYRSSNSQRRFSDTRDGHISPESLGLVSSSVTPKTYSFHSFRTNPDATESISRAAVQTTAGRPEATTAHEELPFLSGTPLSGFKEVTGDFQATRRQPLPQIPEVQSSRTVSSYHETANIENAGRSQYPLTPMDPNSYHPLYQRSQFQESIEGCYTGKHPRRGLMHRGRNSSSSQTIVGRTSIDERLAMGRRIRTSSLQVENNMRGCTPRILPIEPTSVIPEKATVAASAVDMSRKPSPSRQHQRPLRRDQETQALMGGRSSPPSEEEKLKGRELQERFERLTEMEKQQQQQQEMLQKQQDELSPMKGEPPKALNGDRALAGSRNNSPQRCKKQQQPLLQQQSSMRLNTSGQLGRMPSALLGAQYSSISPSQLSAAPLEEPLGSTPSMRSSRSLRSLYQQRQPPSQLHELQHQLDVQQQHNIRERERRAEAELESLMERERQGSRRRQERQQQLAFLQQQQQIFLSQYRRDRQRRRLNCSIDRGLDSSEGVPIQQLLEGATLPENKSTEAAQNEQQGGRAQARMQRPEETSTDSAREGTKNLPKQSTVSSGIFGVRTEDDLRDPGLVEAEARETECAEAAAVVAGTAPASAAQSTATQQEVGADYHRQVFGMPDGIPFGASSGFCGDKARNDVSIRYEATSVQTREDAYTIQKDLAIQQPQLLRMAAASTAATAETLEEAPKEKTADVAVETDFSVETPVSDIFGLERERIDDGENEEAAQHQLQQPQQRSNKKTLPATVERSQEGSEIFALPLEAQRQQQEWDEDTLAAAEGRQQIAAAAAAASAAAAAARAAVATATAAEAQIENTKQGDEVLEIDVLSPEVDEPIELLEPTNEASDAPPYRAGSPSAPQNRSNRAASCSSGRVRAAISEELRETSKTKSNFNHVTGGAEADEEKKHEKAHRRRRRSSGETGCRGPHSAAGVDSTYQHPGQQEAYTDLGEFTQKGLGGLSSHLKRDRHEGRHFSAAAPTLPSAHGLSFPWCAEGSLEGEGHRYAPQFVERYYMKERRGSDAGIDGSSGAAHWSSAGSGTWGHSKGCQTRGSRSLSRRGARLDFSGAPAAAKAFAAKVKDRLKPFLSRQETKGSPGDPVDDLGERPRHLYSGVTHRRSYGATPSEPAASTSAAGVAAASAAMPPTSDFNLSELPMLMRAQQQREANRKRAQQKSAERHRTPDGGISQDRTSSKPSQVAARTPHNLQY